MEKKQAAPVRPLDQRASPSCLTVVNPVIPPKSKVDLLSAVIAFEYRPAA